MYRQLNLSELRSALPRRIPQPSLPAPTDLLSPACTAKGRSYLRRTSAQARIHCMISATCRLSHRTDLYTDRNLPASDKRRLYSSSKTSDCLSRQTNQALPPRKSGPDVPDGLSLRLAHRSAEQPDKNTQLHLCIDRSGFLYCLKTFSKIPDHLNPLSKTYS